VGLKFLVSQAPIAGDVGGRGESIVDEIYTAKSLKTEWFEPIKEDYKNAVRDGTGLHDYLVEGGPPSVCTCNSSYSIASALRTRSRAS
jgi:hypothetical protein